MDLAFEGAPVEIAGDPLLLRELVANLVDNALRYGGAGTAVTVRVGRGGPGQAALEVLDEGPGIPAELRARVFERFFRIPGVAVPGTWLGLSIVKEIAAAHGAAVSLSDARPGVERPGLRVTATFPQG